MLGTLEPPLRLCVSHRAPDHVRCFLVPPPNGSSTMQAPSPFLSDTEYNNLWSSLQQNENHVCTRQVRGCKQGRGGEGGGPARW